MADEPTREEWLERVLAVVARTVVHRAEWNADCICIDRSSAYPEGTNFPTSLALYPVNTPVVFPSLGGPPVEDDEWWAPDSGFVNDDEDDPRQGFRFGEALVVAAQVTVGHAYFALRNGDGEWWASLGKAVSDG